jgi:hypothetical protein
MNFEDNISLIKFNCLDIINSIRKEYSYVDIKLHKHICDYKIKFNIYFINIQQYNCTNCNTKCAHEPCNPYYLEVNLYYVLGSMFIFTKLTNGIDKINIRHILSNENLFNEIELTNKYLIKINNYILK